MNKFKSQNKEHLTEEVNKLVSAYKDQRSISCKPELLGSSNITTSNLNTLNLSPWDYSLDSNITIKPEKDLTFENKYVDENDEIKSNLLTAKDYFDWFKMYNTQTGEKNAVFFASIKTDSIFYEENYLSLKFLLAGCSTSFKRELSALLCPIFVHFYLDLVAKPDLPAAQSFFTKFNHDHEDQQKELIENLSKLTDINQLKFYKNIKLLREFKTVVKLSPNVYLYLLQHLRHGNYTLVLQTLNFRFSLKTSHPISINKSINDLGTYDNDFDEFNMSWSTTATEQQALGSLNQSIAALNSSSKIFKPSICLYSLQSTYKGICCSCFSSQNTSLAAGFDDSSVQLWSLTPKIFFDEKKSESVTLRGHSGVVYQTHFLPNDSHLLTSSKDKSVRLWSLKEKKCLSEYRGHDSTVWDVTSSSPNATYFVSASFDRTLRLWNTEYIYPLRIFAGHTDSVDCVRFHPNGNYLASGSTDKSCRLWDIQTGQFVRVLLGHKAPIYSLVFTRDGKNLISAGDDSKILVWDLSNGKLINEIQTSSKVIYSLTISSDGTMLASGGFDSAIEVWEVESLLKENDCHKKVTYEPIGKYRTNKDRVINLKFTQGNLLMATGFCDER
ncbi:transcription initiation factor TFIID subunit 5 [Hydra vulgaris]|uniref:Transcription initiation factor TFIID subunit 5 n=1 Tax=Hydra vulgaris TaxID=6087 RepID=A0ABM4BI61_HYDVU